VNTKIVHINKQPYDIYIGRHPDLIIGKWGNPYTHHAEKDTLAKYIVSTRKEAIEKYREYILFGEGKHLLNDLHELKGKTLGCWCKPKSCHGDILVELVQKYVPDTNEFF
jgi:hypothetical protein